MLLLTDIVGFFTKFEKFEKFETAKVVYKQ